MTRLTRLFTATMLLFAFAVSPALAQTSAEQADDLRALIENSLDQFARVQHANGLTLDRLGTVSVEPQADYYAVKLPYLNMIAPDGGKFDIGVIAANMRPGEKSSWVVSLAMPTPFILYDATGQKQMEIAIGSQNFAGVWWPEWNTYTRMDATYRDIDISTTEHGVGTIAHAHVLLDMNEVSDGLWSGPSIVKIQGITGDVDGHAQFSLGQLRVDSSVDQFDIARSTALQNDLEEKILTIQENGMEPSEQEVAQMGQNAIDMLVSFANGFSTKFEISDFDFSARPKESADPVSATLKKGYFKMGLDEFMSNSGTVHAGFGFSGLTSSTFGTTQAQIYPQNANADIQVNGVPFRKLVDVTSEAASQTFESLAAGTPDEMTPNTTAQLIASYPQILSEAGAQLSVNDTYVETALSKTDIKGTAIAKPGTTLGGIADFVMTMRGLDALLSAVTQAMETTPDNPQYQGMLMGLSMFQSFGQQQDDGTLSYHFEVTETGEVLLNGQPMATLIGAMMSPQAGSAQDSTKTQESE